MLISRATAYSPAAHGADLQREASGDHRTMQSHPTTKRTLRILMITPELPSSTRPGSMAPTARQIDSLSALGMQIKTLEMKGMPKFKYARALIKTHALSSSVDLIHAHYGYCGWLARSQRTKPVVVSFMGDDLLGTPNASGRTERFSRAMVQANRYLARQVDAVIVKSAEMARVVSPVNAHIVPNGVDMQIFQPMDKRAVRLQLGWADDRRYILFPGNPDNPRKGFDLAQQIISHAGRRLSESLALVPLWGIAPHQVPLYMNGCDAMVMTSLSEGSPNVVKEAMACDLPIISVSVGDVPELLDGVEGCAVRARDAEVLGEALTGVLNCAERSQGRAALARKQLDLASVASRVQTIYETVLSR